MVREHGKVITGEELMEIFNRRDNGEALLLIYGVVAFRGMERAGEEGEYAILGVSPGKGIRTSSRTSYILLLVVIEDRRRK